MLDANRVQEKWFAFCNSVQLFIIIVLAMIQICLREVIQCCSPCFQSHSVVLQKNYAFISTKVYAHQLFVSLEIFIKMVMNSEAGLFLLQIQILLCQRLLTCFACLQALLHACIACSLKPSIDWIAASDLEDESANMVLSLYSCMQIPLMHLLEKLTLYLHFSVFHRHQKLMLLHGRH